MRESAKSQTERDKILTLSENLSTLYSLRQIQRQNPFQIESVTPKGNSDSIMNMEKEDTYLL